VTISDRKNVIDELFLEAQTYEAQPQAGWIICAIHDPLVKDEHSHKLKQYLEKTPIKGHTEFSLSSHNKGNSRTVKQTIQAAMVPLPAISRPSKGLKETHIHAILVKEQAPPTDDKPIEWILLTNLPIDSQSQIETIIQWYRCRWEIKIYFQVLKKGCQIQKLQHETPERFEACLGIYILVAWRLLCLSLLARQYPERPCDSRRG